MEDDAESVVKTLCERYVDTKQRDAVLQREQSSEAVYAKGVLVGYCMAMGWDIETIYGHICILQRDSNVLICRIPLLGL